MPRRMLVGLHYLTLADSLGASPKPGYHGSCKKTSATCLTLLVVAIFEITPAMAGLTRRFLWQNEFNLTKSAFNERTSKRRKGYPSETRVKRGRRVVHGDKELTEKLGRNDPCPCGSGRRFQEMLPAQQTLRWLTARPLLLENEVAQVFVA